MRRLFCMKRLWAITVSMLLVFGSGTSVFAKTYPGKKVLYVDSYHEGYAWSDGITKGVKKGLEGTGIELKAVSMDTKRNGNPGH
jgi:hypothetical protein